MAFDMILIHQCVSLIYLSAAVIDIVISGQDYRPANSLYPTTII